MFTEGVAGRSVVRFPYLDASCDLIFSSMTPPIFHMGSTGYVIPVLVIRAKSITCVVLLL